ncbi:winged helix-turn-helix domain-containing protein [Lentisalinibacter orientalis]|uniref:winged helix-turn-helix domain-containing protein n=1 Tax=Lentisalinibacter orientalis TaxID=2992241 RepID=UPI003864A396
MGENDQPRRYLCIGDLTLDTDTRELRRGDTVLELPGLSYRLLLLLAERAPAVVSQDEITERIWSGRVVSPETVTQRIKLLRQSLGDDARNPQYIALVRGHGYRLLPEVEPVDRLGTGATPEPGQDSAGRRRPALLALGLVAVAATALAYLPKLVSIDQSAEPDYTELIPLEKSIAVLPFEDMSAGSSLDYVGDGIADEVLHRLNQSEDLLVIARTSSFALRNTSLEIPAIAARLGVRYVLQGSVREADGELRVTAQLVDARQNTQVWSRAYEATLGDVLRVQQDIAASIGDTLELQLTDRNAVSADTDPEAYRHYLRGQFFWNRRAAGDVDRAEASYRKALDIDSRLAAAWVGLAAVAMAGFYDEGRGSLAEAVRAQRHALDRALALDPNLAEAHARLCSLLWSLGEPEAGRRHMQRARALAPNSPLVLTLEAGYRIWTGDFEESIELSRRAIAVNPLAASYHYNLGHVLILAGRAEEGIAELNQATALNPAMKPTFLIALARLHQGRYEAAASLVEEFADPSDRYAIEAIALRELGQEAASASALQRLASLETPRSILQVAHVEAWFGDAEAPFRALEELKRLTRQRPETIPQADDAMMTLLQLRFAPYLREAHDNQRWQETIRSLAAQWRDSLDEYAPPRPKPDAS